ncbi:MAG: TIGR02597 family protein [Chthoniobacterales bacterium]
MNRSLFVPLAILSLCAPQLFGQTVATDPVGFTTSATAANSDSYLAVPFTRPPEFVGSLSTASGSTITVAGSPWTANQFVYASGTQPKRYYALIGNGGSSNPKEGRTYAITGNGANTLTVDTAIDNVTGITANTQLMVIPYWTVGTLFPASDANVSFTPSTASAALKTQVWVPDDSATGINLGYLATYYYSNNIDGTASNIGWRKVGDGNTVDHADDVLLPDSYFVLRNANGAPGLPFTALGSVLLKKLTVPLRTATNTPQDNPVSILRPLDVTLNMTGLNPVDGSFGANDQLLVFNNAQVGFDKSPSATYYRDPAANFNWRLVGDASLQDHGNDVIALGTGFIVRKAATANGQSAFWTNSFPLQAVSAVSRKTHGAAGTFDLNLPLTGAPAIEPRAQGSGHQMIVSFVSPVTLTGASVSSGTGSVSAVSGSGTSQLSFTLTAANDQYVTVRLANVTDGVNTNDIAVTVGLLLGDVNQDKTVNGGDAIATKSRSGQTTDASNFKYDVNTDGTVSGGDSVVVRAQSGNSL